MRRISLNVFVLLVVALLAAPSVATAEPEPSSAPIASAGGEAPERADPLGTDDSSTAQSCTFDELNGPDMCLTQPQRGDCVVTSCAMMLRRAERLLGRDGWSLVDVAAIRYEATGSFAGQLVQWDFWHDGIHVQMRGDGIGGYGESAKIAALKDELDLHPEGVVLYAESGGATHAVLLSDYEDDTFYCVDPSPYNITERMPLTSSYLVSIPTACQIWHVERPKVPGPGVSLSPAPVTPTWDYGSDANLPSGWYGIRSVREAASDTSTQIRPHGLSERADQIVWHLDRMDGGAYGIDTIVGKMLYAGDDPKDGGGDAQRGMGDAIDWQRWYIQDCGNGVYALQAMGSGKYLEINDERSADGSSLQQWAYDNTDNQRWVITPWEPYGLKQVLDGWSYVRSSQDSSCVLNASGARQMRH